jgi:dipeptidase E
LSSLYLSGGGDKEQTRGIDKVFASELVGGKPLLYLPVAMNPGDISYEECYKWVHGVFLPFGIADITMWVDLKGKTLKDLMGFSAVYIGGGNTFSLMYHILQSGFHTLLTNFIEEGGIVYGGSAGAIVMGSNISTCVHMDDNDVMLKTRKGFSFLNDYSIWCHYVAENDPLIDQFINSNRMPVIALSEESGLHIKSGRIEVLGTQPAFVFDLSLKKRSIEPGCTI